MRSRVLVCAIFLGVTHARAADAPKAAAESPSSVSFLPSGWRSGSDFGVRCDGTTNDGAAIQRALDSGRGSGTILLPAGTCHLGPEGIHLDGATRLQGAGRDKTVLQYTGPGVALQVNGGVRITTHGWNISDLTLSGLGKGSVGLQIGQMDVTPKSAGGSIDRVTITGFWLAGARLRVAQLVRFEEVYFENNGDGVRVEGVADENDFLSFVSCRFRYNRQRGVYLGEYESLLFQSCDFENNVGEAILVDRGDSRRVHTRGLTLRDCWIERNDTGRDPAQSAQVRFQTAGAPIENTRVERTWFGGRGKGSAEVHLFLARGNYDLIDNSFLSPSGACVGFADEREVVVFGRSTGSPVEPDKLWRGPVPPKDAVLWEHAAAIQSGSEVTASMSLWVNGPNGQLTKGLELASGAGSGADAGVLLGFFGSPPTRRVAIRGARGDRATLASLLAQLARLGLIVDETTP